MKYMVIGGGGFLGSYLVEHLLSKSQTVSVMDTIPLDNATRLSSYIDRITYLWKSVHDLEPKDLEGVDYIVHLASQADVPMAISSPRYTFNQNVMGVVNMLEILRRLSESGSGPRKSVYMSSENVYGLVPVDRLPIREDEPLKPINPYGGSKAAADITCQTYNYTYKIPISVIRSSTMYGPRSRLRQAIPIFIRQALANKPITIEGDGSQSRDFNYVQNSVNGVVKVLQGDTGVYNIASGKELTIREVAETIISVTGSKSKIEFKPWRAGEEGVRLSISIEKARRAVGYEPQVNFEDGIMKTVEWLRTQSR